MNTTGNKEENLVRNTWTKNSVFINTNQTLTQKLAPRQLPHAFFHLGYGKYA